MANKASPQVKQGAVPASPEGARAEKHQRELEHLFGTAAEAIEIAMLELGPARTPFRVATVQLGLSHEDWLASLQSSVSSRGQKLHAEATYDRSSLSYTVQTNRLASTDEEYRKLAGAGIARMIRARVEAEYEQYAGSQRGFLSAVRDGYRDFLADRVMQQMLQKDLDPDIKQQALSAASEQLPGKRLKPRAEVRAYCHNQCYGASSLLHLSRNLARVAVWSEESPFSAAPFVEHAEKSNAQTRRRRRASKQAARERYASEMPYTEKDYRELQEWLKSFPDEPRAVAPVADQNRANMPVASAHEDAPIAPTTYAPGRVRVELADTHEFSTTRLDLDTDTDTAPIARVAGTEERDPGLLADKKPVVEKLLAVQPQRSSRGGKHRSEPPWKRGLRNTGKAVRAKITRTA